MEQGTCLDIIPVQRGPGRHAPTSWKRLNRSRVARAGSLAMARAARRWHGVADRAKSPKRVQDGQLAWCCSRLSAIAKAVHEGPRAACIWQGSLVLSVLVHRVRCAGAVVRQASVSVWIKLPLACPPWDHLERRCHHKQCWSPVK